MFSNYVDCILFTSKNKWVITTQKLGQNFATHDQITQQIGPVMYCSYFNLGMGLFGQHDEFI